MFFIGRFFSSRKIYSFRQLSGRISSIRQNYSPDIWRPDIRCNPNSVSSIRSGFLKELWYFFLYWLHLKWHFVLVECEEEESSKRLAFLEDTKKVMRLTEGTNRDKETVLGKVNNKREIYMWKYLLEPSLNLCLLSLPPYLTCLVNLFSSKLSLQRR